MYDKLYDLSGLVFLRGSFGLGLFLIFCGFLVVKEFNMLTFPTWAGISMLSFGIIFIIDALEVCCGTAVDTGTLGENKQLLRDDKKTAV
jgi:hypothetical protein